MSRVSNHYPEVIDEVNGRDDGRDGDDFLVRLYHAGEQDESGARTVSVPAEALARYEVTHNRLFGFLEGLLADMGRAVGPNTVEQLYRQLQTKLAEVEAEQLAWIHAKCGTR